MKHGQTLDRNDRQSSSQLHLRRRYYLRWCAGAVAEAAANQQGSRTVDESGQHTLPKSSKMYTTSPLKTAGPEHSKFV